MIAMNEPCPGLLPAQPSLFIPFHCLQPSSSQIICSQSYKDIRLNLSYINEEHFNVNQNHPGHLPSLLMSSSSSAALHSPRLLVSWLRPSSLASTALRPLGSSQSSSLLPASSKSSRACVTNSRSCSPKLMRKRQTCWLFVSSL